MGLYRYTAIGDKGNKITGTIDAETEPLAKEKLRREKILITELKLLSQSKKEKNLASSLKLAFTRELGQLLKAGLPLYESLLTLEEKYRRHKSHTLFLSLLDKIKSGTHLSSALNLYPETFDPVYISMIRAAEESGRLAQALEELSLLIRRQEKLKKELWAAASYPAFLGIFCLLVAFCLLFFVIPSMKELFEGRELHPLTRFVLSLSEFLQAHGITLLLSLSVFLLGFIWVVRRKASQVVIQKIFLSIPILKTVILYSALIRFCKAGSILLKGGVSFIDAVRLSREVMNNRPLQEILAKAEAEVLEGKSFSENLKDSPYIPPLCVRMIAIGEETGNMARMLENIAEIYEEELDKNLQQLSTFLQPILLLFLGLVVGSVLLAVLLPLTDVGSILE